MKKISLVLILFLVFCLTACQGTPQPIVYSDDEPFVLEMSGDTLKILQFTDLHLTYGIDANDRKTLEMMEKLATSDDFDLIVITGDMTLSTAALALFSQLVKEMESLKIPWTFVFGNHETDYNEYQDFLSRIEDTDYLLFKTGPEMVDGGVGNFVIQFTQDSVPFYNLYLMDSHSEETVYTEEAGEYGYVSTAQVDWYTTHVTEDLVDSVMFMHIPLRQFMNPAEYVGIFEEDKVYAQGIDTGLFDAIVQAGKTMGVFVGHDHLNDFYLIKNGVYLAYGRISGYNAYGNIERGGRVIAVSTTGVMTTSVLLENEVQE